MARSLFIMCVISLVVSGMVAFGEDQRPLPVLAVADFSGNNPALCQAVTETVLTDLAKSRGLTLVERAQLRQAMNELRLQQSGLAEGAEMAHAGRLIGATHVVVGSVSVNEHRVILNARVLDVRTGTLYAGAAENTEGWSDEIFALAHDLANRLHYRLTGESLPGFTEPVSPSVESTPALPIAMPTPVPAPDWENLTESPAIAWVLGKGWMRLFADGSFRPYEPVTERYFYETLRRFARHFGRDDTRWFPAGDGSGTVTRITAVRAVDALVSGKPTYFLDVPPWAITWLNNSLHKPLTRAHLARLLQLAEEQLRSRITSSVSVSSVLR
ncbi:MAG: CsgG/HfaB family protein [Armatimonadota bacterium]